MLTIDPSTVFARIPGQDPSILRTVEKMPKEVDPIKMLDLPIRTANDVIDGIINDPGEKQQWIYFIQNTLMTSRNSLDLRRELISKAYYLDPILRNILAMRAMKYFNYVNKSFFHFHIDLEKAINRGGKYFKRVPRKNGKGYTYYYSEDDYDKSPNAHVNGDKAHTSYLSNKIKNILVSSKGGDASIFKNLIQKYGVDKVEKILRDEVKKGNISLKNKKFMWVAKEEPKK